jgi:hypothetical protein
MDVSIKLTFNLLSGNTRGQVTLRPHTGQHGDNIFIDVDSVFIRLIKISFRKIFIIIDFSLAPVEVLGKHHSANTNNGGNNDSPAIGQIRHNAPLCGKDFSVTTELYRTEGPLYRGVKGR